jgi:glycosyltransferase 2 family protein
MVRSKPVQAAISSRWLKLMLSAVFLGVLLHEADLGDIGHVLAGASLPWVFGAFAGYLLSQLVSSVRWYLLARPLGFREPLWRFVSYYFSGMYLNLFAPSTVAGDIGRALFLARGRRRAHALTTVLADRGIGLVALIWVGAAAILLVPGYPLPAIARWAALLTPPLTAVGWLWGPLIAVRILPAGNRWRAFVERDLAPYWKDPQLLGASFAVAGVFHTLQIATQVMLAYAIGMRVAWPFFFVFVPIVNLIGMLPISFSGIGIREGGYWYFLSLVGVDREAAVALGLLSSAVVLASGVAGAPAFLLRHQPQGVSAGDFPEDKTSEGAIAPDVKKRTGSSV